MRAPARSRIADAPLRLHPPAPTVEQVYYWFGVMSSEERGEVALWNAADVAAAYGGVEDLDTPRPALHGSDLMRQLQCGIGDTGTRLSEPVGVDIASDEMVLRIAAHIAIAADQ